MKIYNNNFNPTIAAKNHSAHISTSPLICGNIEKDDKVNIRTVKSNIELQISIF